jgi:hypothetical protein
VQVWWSGGGVISDANFAALLESRPDACFEVSGVRAFTDNQVARLSEAGIAYFVLPALSSRDSLKETAVLVGDVLGGGAPGIAASYNAWADSAVREAGNASPAELTGLYISGWDYSASYQLNDTKGMIESAGSGLAIAYSPTKPQLVSDFMLAANVINESTRNKSAHRDAKYVYVSPMFHQFLPVVSGSAASYYSGESEYGFAYDLFVARMISDSI